MVLAGCGSSPAHPGPLALLRSSVAAANQTGSVHFVESVTTGQQVSTLEGNLSAPAAEEALIDDGTQLEAELTHNVIYVRGTAASLQSALGLSAAVSQQNAGQWISIQPTDGPFADVSSTLTLSSILGAFTPENTATTKSKDVTLHKEQVLAFTGIPSSGTSPGVSAVVSLFIARHGSHEPVGGTAVYASGSTRTSDAVVFSQWGVPVTVAAPVGAHPYSSLGG